MSYICKGYIPLGEGNEYREMPLDFWYDFDVHGDIYVEEIPGLFLTDGDRESLEQQALVHYQYQFDRLQAISEDHAEAMQRERRLDNERI